MPRRSDNTTIGGGNGEFVTTQWSQILSVDTAEGEKQRLLLDNLTRMYWKPVYCYIRRKGHSNDRAKDLTQGFFCDVVLGGSLIKRADRGRGRFRKFLPAATADLNPSEVFDYARATQILDETLKQVKEQCLRTNKGVHWRLFDEKVLRPILHGTPGPSFADLCGHYGIRDEHVASNMVITVKRCFRRILDNLLRRHGGKDSALEDEYRDLFRHLGADGAG